MSPPRQLLLAAGALAARARPRGGGGRAGAGAPGPVFKFTTARGQMANMGEMPPMAMVFPSPTHPPLPPLNEHKPTLSHTPETHHSRPEAATASNLAGHTQHTNLTKPTAALDYALPLFWALRDSHGAWPRF